MHFSGRFILNIAEFASRQGADFAELLTLSGLDAQELNTEDRLVGSEVYNRVLLSAIEMTGDQLMGLHAGENLNLSAAGLIVQISQTSETVKQALDYCCEFANLGCRSLPMSLEEHPEYFELTLTPNALWLEQSAEAVRHTAEGTLAFTIREFQSLTRRKHQPIAILLPWERTGPLDEYERVLDAPVQFGQDRIAIRFERAHLEEPVVTSDYDLLRILVAHAEERSAQLAKEQGFSSMVKQSVIRLVKPQFPTIEQVASHLNVSMRTLQRKLQLDGTTYKQLIDDLRKEFAMGYLRREDLSIGDIAYLLSYADTSAFTRSFKRWTGKSPNAYRAAIR